MKKILVPVDGSESARHAARFAAQLRDLSSAEVTLLHVYDVHSAEAMGLMALLAADLERAKVEAAQESFRAATEALGEPAPAACEVVMGNPAEEILLMAKRGGFDLIVMGHRGRSPVKELLLGSVSDKIVRGASCPVTIVR